jgi:hypothetical protein
LNIIDFVDEKNRNSLRDELKTLKELVNELEEKLRD